MLLTVTCRLTLGDISAIYFRHFTRLADVEPLQLFDYFGQPFGKWTFPPNTRRKATFVLCDNQPNADEFNDTMIVVRFRFYVSKHVWQFQLAMHKKFNGNKGAGHSGGVILDGKSCSIWPERKEIEDRIDSVWWKLGERIVQKLFNDIESMDWHGWWMCIADCCFAQCNDYERWHSFCVICIDAKQQKIKMRIIFYSFWNMNNNNKEWSILLLLEHSARLWIMRIALNIGKNGRKLFTLSSFAERAQFSRIVQSSETFDTMPYRNVRSWHICLSLHFPLSTTICASE